MTADVTADDIRAGIPISERTADMERMIESAAAGGELPPDAPHVLRQAIESARAQAPAPSPPPPEPAESPVPKPSPSPNASPKATESKPKSPAKLPADE